MTPDLLEKLARRLTNANYSFGGTASERVTAVLREVHLDELLEAGQAMREHHLPKEHPDYLPQTADSAKAWDAAKKAFEESLGGS